MNIAIYIYDQAEVLDFSGPFEVFSTASRICPNENPFNVFLVSETGDNDTVKARGGFTVTPSYGFHNHPAIDILIVAGGEHTDELKKTRVIRWIAETGKKAALAASVCTGVFLLARAGLVTNHNVTTHWMDIPELRNSYTALTVHECVRWIDEGPIVTSGGISAGIDMSLHLVGRLHSVELAEKTARRMDYPWKHNS